jgi:hypothetical protein
MALNDRACASASREGRHQSRHSGLSGSRGTWRNGNRSCSRSPVRIEPVPRARNRTYTVATCWAKVATGAQAVGLGAAQNKDGAQREAALSRRRQGSRSTPSAILAVWSHAAAPW